MTTFPVHLLEYYVLSVRTCSISLLDIPAWDTISTSCSVLFWYPCFIVSMHMYG